jgi:hypothetical protein
LAALNALIDSLPPANLSIVLQGTSCSHTTWRALLAFKPAFFFSTSM